MRLRHRLILVAAILVASGVGLVAVRPWVYRQSERGTLRAAFDAEFLTRPDGYAGLARHYHFRFPEEPRQMDPGLMYRAIADGAVDVIDGFATDGRIEAYDLVVLEDDRHFFPPYYAAPLVRRATLTRYPQLKDILNLLAGRISDDEMRRMNYLVDEEGRRPAVVAREFLLRQGLLPPDFSPPKAPRGTITIGGKPFTEQQILGEIMATLIEAKARLRVDRRFNLGGTMICFQALRAGDLDLYPEYTGTGLVNILKREVISDPEESYQLVKEAFERKYDLIWLAPFGFNNTYTLTMRREHARRLGIKTLSDLAAYLSSR